MARFAKLLALAGCAAVVIAAVPAGAATPATAALSKTKKSISWNGTATPLFSPVPDPILDCQLISDPNCDHFTLKIDLGEGAKIQVILKGEDPANANSPTKPYNDFDAYIYAPDHTIVAQASTASGNETLTFTHRAKWRKQAYDVAVRSWAVIPGATYKGTAKAITLGK
jgi:hypothetical protein